MAGAGEYRYLAGSGLVGREAEVSHIKTILDRGRSTGGVLLVRGEPGIGKSALLDHGRASGEEAGFVVVRASGVEAESHLAFAGLHQLVRPFLARAQQLPAPQRGALEVAF